MGRLEATPTDRGLRFTCTCSDGSEGLHCEHRIVQLLGDVSALTASLIVLNQIRRFCSPHYIRPF
ncbi:hypothetical protein ASF39_19745 [Methylobacterium sp. Leaf108]|nr:hypothetical protein ASF39_19745 [Methylobacterium sp. Leaf108]